MIIQVRTSDELILLAEGEETEATEAEGTEAPPNPVIPEVNHLLWAAISFFALWALMKYVLLPPLLKERARREAYILRDREAAEVAKSSLSKMQAEYDGELARARAEADGIIEEARAEAGEHRANVMAGATTEVADIRSGAASGLEEERSSAIGSMKGDVGDIAVAAASAVLGKDLDRGAQQSAIDSALQGGNS